MNCLRRSLASCCLAAGLLPAQARDAAPPILIVLDRTAHTLQIQARVPGDVLVAVGELAVPPLVVRGIELDVRPDVLLALGPFAAGEVRTFPVPRFLRESHVEAVLVDSELRLRDSNVVALADAFLDLADATFRAELVSTDGIPPTYTLAASLSTGTDGYALTVDGIAAHDGVTDVYLRLVAPAEDEMTLPVVTDHAAHVDLGTVVGTAVRVHLLRARRGAVGLEVYRLMVTLPVL